MRRLNRWLAVKVTKVVGTMWCAYAFAALTLTGLPVALRPGGIGLIAWIAQEFLQLVLLSILAVGQQVTSEQVERHGERVKRHLQVHSEAVHAALDEHHHRLTAAIHTHLTAPARGTDTTRKGTAP